MKDPAFLFYSSDFLTGTMTLSDEQVGKYIRLLCFQHQTGHIAEKDMLNICKTYDKDVISKFEKDSDGLYFNERLEIESVKRKNYSLSRSENRKNKNISKTYVPHMENVNINKDISKDISNVNNSINEAEEKRKQFCDSIFDYFEIAENIRSLNIQKLHLFYSTLFKENKMELFTSQFEKYKKYRIDTKNKFRFSLDNFIKEAWFANSWDVNKILLQTNTSDLFSYDDMIRWCEKNKGNVKFTEYFETVDKKNSKGKPFWKLK